jgi:hypothetical protein
MTLMYAVGATEASALSPANGQLAIPAKPIIAWRSNLQLENTFHPQSQSASPGTSVKAGHTRKRRPA